MTKKRVKEVPLMMALVSYELSSNQIELIHQKFGFSDLIWLRDSLSRLFQDNIVIFKV